MSLFKRSHSTRSNPQMEDAVKEGNLEKVLALCKQDPEAASRRVNVGMTPLGLAAYRGHPTIVAALLEHGADPAETCHAPGMGPGQTPLDIARQRSFLDVVEVFRKMGSVESKKKARAIEKEWEKVEIPEKRSSSSASTPKHGKASVSIESPTSPHGEQPSFLDVVVQQESQTKIEELTLLVDELQQDKQELKRHLEESHIMIHDLKDAILTLTEEKRILSEKVQLLEENVMKQEDAERDRAVGEAAEADVQVEALHRMLEAAQADVKRLSVERAQSEKDRVRVYDEITGWICGELKQRYISSEDSTDVG